MPRRVLSVTASHVKQHKLDTEAGRKAFLKHRMEDAEDWTSQIHTHPSGSQMLVIDHNNPTKPLHELKSYNHGGQKLVHSGGLPDVSCAEGGCKDKAVHGSSYCPKHFKLPMGSK